ncbi:MAG: calcium-binding protein [Nitrospira sp.]|nr:calcium-binding protein [Nitrospira sp.]
MTAVVSLVEAREAADRVYNELGSLPTGWTIDATFGLNGSGQVTGSAGGYVYALKPAGTDDGQRMLVFRGTELTLTNLKDLFADMTDIGRIQFEELRGGANGVNQWLAQQLVTGNRVELVGHSLGGALVQWAINDTNMREENADNDGTLISVLEIAKQLDGDFVLDPSQLHFTTFNAPGITHVLGGSTPATDRTSAVVGEHHVVIGQPPIIQGDPIHLLGGLHVGAPGTQLVGHQVEFSELSTSFQQSGLFAHTIQVPEYWTSPVVPYTPLQLDLAFAQSFANHYSQLGNTDGTVEGNTEAVVRLTLYVSSLGVALSVGQLAEQAEAATQLAGLQFDRDMFANTLAIPGVGINQALNILTQAADAAGQSVVQLQKLVSSALVSVGERIQGTVGVVGTIIEDRLVSWLTDVAHGIGNAMSEFFHNVPDTLFDLGRTLSFADLNPFTNTYAQALDDPKLDPTLRTALEEAQAIVQQAGQTVVIQTGVGPNPFHTPGYAPGGASSATVEERLGELFRLSVPFAAGAGGQRVSLRLQGPQADQLTVATDDGAQVIGADGTFQVTVPEGADQVLFTLVASDEVSADATVTLSATLVDVNGDATHTTQIESVVSVKPFVGTTDDRYGTYTEDWSSITDPTVGVAMGTAGGFYHQTLIGGAGPDANAPGTVYGDDKFYGNGGNDSFFGGRGHDLLDGGAGNDTLFGDNIDDRVDQPWHEVPDPRSTQDGKDYLDGGAGNDRLGGGGNDDRLIGGVGDDVLWGDVYTAGRIIEQNFNEYVIQYLTGVLYPGNDVLEGGEGNDALSGDGGDDVLDGGEGNDILVGDTEQGLNLIYPTTPGNDFLTGGAGNDQLDGNAGDDVLLGGSGNDQLSGDDDGVDSSQEGADWLEGGDGDDVLLGRGGDDTLLGDAGVDALYGGVGNDSLIGGEGNDVGFGGTGDDEIIAGEGIDQFDGESGNDVVFGDEGNDLLLGGDGLDELDGGAGDDLFGGGADADTIFGGEGNDELQGGLGNDVLAGDAGDDRIFGEEDNDQIFGGDGNDGLRGDDGNDELDGGAGDDILVGDVDGQIGGSGGNDILVGGAGNDTLVGGGGQDTYLYELGDGFDVIEEAAGEGNRLVFGAGISSTAMIAAMGPDDSLVLRTGIGEEAVQIQNFGVGNLNGPHPIESFEFSDGTILTYAQLAATGLAISGWLGDDQLAGTAQGERIFGGAGNDVVNAGAGNDVLMGAAGNDTLFGEAGQDTYIFAKGGGFDSIQDRPGEGNRLVFGSGISQANLSLSFKQVTIPGGGGEEEGDPGTVINYLVLRPGGTGDAVEIQWFDPANQLASLGVDQFVFADGTMLTASQLLANGLELVGTAGFDTLDGQEIYRTIRGLAGDDVLMGGTIDNVIDGGDGRDVLLGNGGFDQIFGATGDDVLRGGDGNDVLNGEAGNDSLEGEAGDDVLVGGAGDDQLLGGDGSDTYRFNIGDGLDSLFDSGAGADTDTVLFGSGITSDSVSLSPQFGQIVINVGTGSDGIQSGSAFDVFGSQTIEQFQFADGTVLSFADLVAQGFNIDGTEFDDFLSGTDLADRFRGGLGNDRLEGAEGHDSYFFNVGDGIDTIMDMASADAGNEIVFGAGITYADLRLDLTLDQSDPDQSDLLIRMGTNGDAIQLDSFDRNHVFGPRTVESFRFADASTLRYEQLLAGGFDLTGTDGDDQITGTNVMDRIVTGDGADVLRSGLGDDRLDGGLGADRLFGGRGNDTYLFGPGAGQDTIVEFQGSSDVIRMAPGVAPSDVVVSRNNNDLVLSLNGGADRLTVSLYFLAPPLQTELVQFSDGTVWDQALIENLTRPVISGTAGPDFLVGTNGHDRLVGLAGDDQLTGLAGSDLLDGGPGVDQLAGNSGDDTYIVDDQGDVVTESANEGIDTVRSSVTRTLETDVENLTLTGSAAIHGTGNALDNVLIGNSGANVLTGGSGNDSYVIGADDTVVESAGEGIDGVQTGASSTLGTNVENLTLTGSASLIGVGNELANVLKADGSISVLAGGDGNDTYVIGPNGDDDILIETVTGGIDTVIAGHDYRLPVNIENLTLLDPRVPDFASFSLIPYGSFEQSVTGYGNNLANTLIGGRTNNVLDGGLGADRLIGGDGNDTYVVDHVGDMAIEEASEGVDTVQSIVSYSLSANVENLTLIGITPVNGTGNELNNELRGNEASNVLDGGAGDDALLGFGGADTYLFGLGSGRDTVFDSELAGEIDTIQFNSTVAAEDVEVYRNGFNLELVISGTTDELTVLSFFGSPEYDQKQVRFADDTLWNSAELSARALIGNVVTGSSESETILGSDGHDLLIGSSGNDVLMGGRGKDSLYGDLTFQPQSGQQVVGDDRLIGGVGDDSLIDFRGNNVFDGGAGDDTLILGTGVDRVLFGRGSGDDHVTLDNNRNDIDLIEMAAEIIPADVVMTWRAPSVADILIPDSGDRLTVQLSTDWFAVGPETTQAIVRFADGTEWNLAWSSSNVGISTATSSDDVLETSFPASLVGLDGDDTYLLGSSSIPGNYEVIEAPGGGIDTVQSAQDYTLPDNVENLVLADFTADNGVGNELDNLIVGNTRDNILDGGAGNDVLVGGIFRELEGPPYIEGTGSDILIGGEGDDILMEDAGNLSFVGGIPFLGGGLDRRDAVPRETDDLLIGGLGNDTYIVHSQEQTAAELENEGTDTVKSTVSYILGEHLENLELVSPPASFDDQDNLISPPPLNGTGNELDNVLIGSEDGNVLSGLTGRDTLVGGLDNDVLRGGTGHDTYLFNLGDGIDMIEDVAAVGEGNLIQFGVGISRNDLIVRHDEVARTLIIQVGTSGTDRLVLNNFDLTGANGSLVVETLAFADGSTTGINSFFRPTITEGDDTITTAAGDDVIDALGGDDIVDAGAGNDTIAGGIGNDTLLGGSGDDTYVYNIGDGVDTINDSSLPSGTNTLEFGAGIDPADLSLDVGSLLLHIGTSGDALHLSYFDPNNVLGPRTIETFRFADGTVLSYDQLVQRGFDLTGTGGNDSITGTNVVDRITALAGDDSLAGGQGHDLLDGGSGTDTMRGGTGNDTYIVDVAGDVVTELADEGTDTVQTSLLRYTLGANLENLTLTGTGPSTGIGNALSNQLSGNNEANLLDGKAGADTMVGGAGNDLYIVDQVGDVVTEATNEGFDIVASSVTYGLGVNVEHLVLTGSAAINGIGNDLDNKLTGNSGANVLAGLAGNDTYVIGVDDTVIEEVNSGTDTVVSALTHNLAADVENLTLVGFSAINGTGNERANVLNGLLSLGRNTLTGGAGDDTYIIGSRDTVVEAAGEGTDTVQTSATHTLGANVENLTLTGADVINGTGNGLNNTLMGNSSNNVLTGAGGNDTLRGNEGDDRLNGGSGNDTYLLSRGDGQDLLQDKSGTTDKLRYDTGIDPLDLVISRQANDLRLAIHGSTDMVTIQNWYTSTANRTETIQAGNGEILLSTQVDQLIQAMAGFTQQTGLPWDQAIDQQPQDVQAVLAASWQ